jgi:RNA polymerase sigma-70 factor, ECF subfamily
MSLPASPSDDDLLRRTVAGDEAAFLTLYRRRQSGVYRFALQMSGSTTIAEDVTQEVFMALIYDGDRFDPGKGSLASYLYGIARHQVLRRLERDRFLTPLVDESSDEAIVPETLVARTDPLRDLTQSEMIEAVRSAVLALPAHYREAVVLCDLHELSYKEAASVTGCAVGTIRSRLHRARALLLEKLREADSSASRALNTTRCFA